MPSLLIQQISNNTRRYDQIAQAMKRFSDSSDRLVAKIADLSASIVVDDKPIASNPSTDWKGIIQEDKLYQLYQEVKDYFLVMFIKVENLSASTTDLADQEIKEEIRNLLLDELAQAIDQEFGGLTEQDREEKLNLIPFYELKAPGLLNYLILVPHYKYSFITAHQLEIIKKLIDQVQIPPGYEV